MSKSCPMKKGAILSVIMVLALAFGSFATWLGGHWYGVIDAIQGVTIFYSKNEMFIFIGHSKAVLEGRRLNLIMNEELSGLLFPDHVRDDLLVAHLKDGKLLKSDLKGFGYFGTPFACQGQAYWYLGISNIYRLHDSNVVPLSHDETSLLDSQITSLGESSRAAGWKDKFFHVEASVPEVTVRMQSEEVRVYADVQALANGRNQRVRVMLARSGTTNATDTLIDVVQGYQRIKKEEYIKVKSQTNVQ